MDVHTNNYKYTYRGKDEKETETHMDVRTNKHVIQREGQTENSSLGGTTCPK